MCVILYAQCPGCKLVITSLQPTAYRCHVWESGICPGGTQHVQRILFGHELGRFACENAHCVLNPAIQDMEHREIERKIQRMYEAAPAGYWEVDGNDGKTENADNSSLVGPPKLRSALKKPNSGSSGPSKQVTISDTNSVWEYEDDNKERLPTSRDPWTQDEIAILVDKHAEGLSFDSIQRVLVWRSARACEKKFNELLADGFVPGPAAPWPPVPPRDFF